MILSPLHANVNGPNRWLYALCAVAFIGGGRLLGAW
jgi:hypothetical protein